MYEVARWAFYPTHGVHMKCSIWDRALLLQMSPLLCVNCQVFLQDWSPTKMFTTLITVKLSFFRMSEQMCFQSKSLSETLPALITGVRYLSGVDPYMSLKGLFACQSFLHWGQLTYFLASVFVFLFTSIRPKRNIKSCDMSNERQTRKPQSQDHFWVQELF